jgi:hypothetical protein
MRGPQDKHLAVLFGLCWGCALGWLQPQHTTAYVPIIPRNQEAEMIGLYLFAGQILSWLPPTVFTIMNESHVPMSYGLGSLSMYFVVSLLCLYGVGDYNQVVRTAGSVVSDQPPTDWTEEPKHHGDGDHHDRELISMTTKTTMTSSKKNNHKVSNGHRFEKVPVFEDVRDHEDDSVYYPSSPSTLHHLSHHHPTTTTPHEFT